MLDYWQRIEQIIKWAGAASVSAFAREIGLNRSENLYQIRRGNNGISRELAESIVTRYQHISKAWVLTGEGDMLTHENTIKKNSIPFYKKDAIELMEHIHKNSTEELQADDLLPEPSYYVSIPMFERCEFAAFTFSEAMKPDIDKGSILFFEHIKNRVIVPGNIYMIFGPKFKGIRQVRKSPNDDMIRLVPKNSDNYDTVTIKQSDIELLFMVKGVLKNT